MKKNRIGGNQHIKKIFEPHQIYGYTNLRHFYPKHSKLEIIQNPNMIGIHFREDLEYIESFYKVKINP